MKKLSLSQLHALLFYEGDTSWVTTPTDDLFWHDKKAYCTLNSLFFPEIGNERARAAEGKGLNPAFLDNTEWLMKLCLDLLSVFEVDGEDASPRTTYRVERLANFEELEREGRTISFTSTSTAGFLSEYSDKKQLVLMEFHLPEGLPQAELTKLLPDYQKAEEQELLLPPWLPLCFKDHPLSDEESMILDQDGNPPVKACVVTVGEPIGLTDEPIPMNPDGAEAGQRVMNALNAGEEPSGEDVAAYSAWKKAFVSHLKHHILTERKEETR